MELEPVWFKYATFDEDGFVNGIRADAPEYAKEAYQAYQDAQRRAMQNHELIPR